MTCDHFAILNDSMSNLDHVYYRVKDVPAMPYYLQAISRRSLLSENNIQGDIYDSVEAMKLNLHARLNTHSDIAWAIKTPYYAKSSHLAIGVIHSRTLLLVHSLHLFQLTLTS